MYLEELKNSCLNLMAFQQKRGTRKVANSRHYWKEKWCEYYIQNLMVNNIDFWLKMS